MSTSATGGQLVFSYNTFLQRGLNLLDLSDVPTARANLGISSANGLTFGAGLSAGASAFDFSAPVTVTVNSSTTGTASTIAQYDSSGGFTTAGVLNLAAGTTPVASTINFKCGTSTALGTLTRDFGTNGGMALTNTGTGGLTLTGSLLSLVSSGLVSVVSATNCTFNSATGTTIGLSAGATGQTSLTVNSTGGAGAANQALAVSGGAVIDTLTVSGKVTVADTCTLNGGLSVPSGKTLTLDGTLGGATGTALYTSIGNKLDTLTSGTQSLTSTLTMANQPSWSWSPPYAIGNPWTGSTAGVSTYVNNKNGWLNLIIPVVVSAPYSGFSVNAVASNRGISVVYALGGTRTTGVISITTAGRYQLSFTGQVSGDGQVAILVNDVATVLWNGNATVCVCGTVLLDLSAGATVMVGSKANSGSFTVSTGYFVGQMIG